jgi:hypothetical protein
MVGFGGEDDELVLHVGWLNALTPMFIIQDMCSSVILILLQLQRHSTKQKHSDVQEIGHRLICQ